MVVKNTTPGTQRVKGHARLYSINYKILYSLDSQGNSTTVITLMPTYWAALLWQTGKDWFVIKHNLISRYNSETLLLLDTILRLPLSFWNILKNWQNIVQPGNDKLFLKRIKFTIVKSLQLHGCLLSSRRFVPKK